MTALATIAATVAMIVGHPVPVTCQYVAPSIAGEAWFGDTTARIELDPQTCNQMTVGMFAVIDREAYAWGMLVTVHEAEHIRYQDGNEAVTECRALRDFPLAVTRVLPYSDALDRADATMLRDQMTGYAESAARFSMPAYYLDGTC